MGVSGRTDGGSQIPVDPLLGLDHVVVPVEVGVVGHAVHFELVGVGDLEGGNPGSEIHWCVNPGEECCVFVDPAGVVVVEMEKIEVA